VKIALKEWKAHSVPLGMIEGASAYLLLALKLRDGGCARLPEMETGAAEEGESLEKFH